MCFFYVTYDTSWKYCRENEPMKLSKLLVYEENKTKRTKHPTTHWVPKPEPAHWPTSPTRSDPSRKTWGPSPCSFLQFSLQGSEGIYQSWGVRRHGEAGLISSSFPISAGQRQSDQSQWPVTLKHRDLYSALKKAHYISDFFWLEKATTQWELYNFNIFESF